MSVRRIPLGRSGSTYAVVDKSDYKRVSKYKWRLRDGYVVRGSGTHIFTLHADIMGVDRSCLVDHRNGNGLDNRKGNLRVASRSQNMINKKLRSDNTSGFKGVSRAGKRWVAAIGHNGQQIRLGLFDSPQTAAIAYDDAARKLYGDHARYNFPKSGELGVRDGCDGFRSNTYIRTTVSIPKATMEQIRKYTAERPGLTVSAFLTSASIAFMERGI